MARTTTKPASASPKLAGPQDAEGRRKAQLAEKAACRERGGLQAQHRHAAAVHPTNEQLLAHVRLVQSVVGNTDKVRNSELEYVYFVLCWSVSAARFKAAWTAVAAA